MCFYFFQRKRQHNDQRFAESCGEVFFIVFFETVQQKGLGASVFQRVFFMNGFKLNRSTKLPTAKNCLPFCHCFCLLFLKPPRARKSLFFLQLKKLQQLRHGVYITPLIPEQLLQGMRICESTKALFGKLSGANQKEKQQHESLQ